MADVHHLNLGLFWKMGKALILNPFCDDYRGFLPGLHNVWNAEENLVESILYISSRKPNV